MTIIINKDLFDYHKWKNTLNQHDIDNILQIYNHYLIIKYYTKCFIFEIMPFLLYAMFIIIYLYVIKK